MIYNIDSGTQYSVSSASMVAWEDQIHGWQPKKSCMKNMDECMHRCIGAEEAVLIEWKLLPSQWDILSYCIQNTSLWFPQKNLRPCWLLVSVQWKSKTKISSTDKINVNIFSKEKNRNKHFIRHLQALFQSKFRDRTRKFSAQRWLQHCFPQNTKALGEEWEDLQGLSLGFVVVVVWVLCIDIYFFEMVIWYLWMHEPCKCLHTDYCTSVSTGFSGLTTFGVPEKIIEKNLSIRIERSMLQGMSGILITFKAFV